MIVQLCWFNQLFYQRLTRLETLMITTTKTMRFWNNFLIIYKGTAIVTVLVCAFILFVNKDLLQGIQRVYSTHVQMHFQFLTAILFENWRRRGKWFRNNFLSSIPASHLAGTFLSSPCLICDLYWIYFRFFCCRKIQFKTTADVKKIKNCISNINWKCNWKPKSVENFLF